MRRNNNFIFALFILVLASGLMHLYSVLQDHFSPLKDYKLQLAHSQEESQRDQLKLALMENQMMDLREQVASVGVKLNSLPGRSIASVAPAVGEPLVLSSALMARGKSFFQKAQYAEAIKAFKEAIDKYPASVSMPEAHFFLAESYYLNNQFQDSLDVIQIMMSQFPENELTGYIMLRMGLIMQSRNRSDEAAEIYQTLLEKYPHEKKLVSQAQNLLSDMTKR